MIIFILLSIVVICATMVSKWFNKSCQGCRDPRRKPCKYPDSKECCQEVRDAVLEVVHGDIMVGMQRNCCICSTSRRLLPLGLSPFLWISPDSIPGAWECTSMSCMTPQMHFRSLTRANKLWKKRRQKTKYFYSFLEKVELRVPFWFVFLIRLGWIFVSLDPKQLKGY